MGRGEWAQCLTTDPTCSVSHVGSVVVLLAPAPLPIQGRGRGRGPLSHLQLRIVILHPKPLDLFQPVGTVDGARVAGELPRLALVGPVVRLQLLSGAEVADGSVLMSAAVQ